MFRSFLTIALLASPMAGAHATTTTPVPSAATRRWDATGHRAMAAVAYDRLRPATRARVDALMRTHPDVGTLGADLDLTTPVGMRELFLRASVWPDRIRSDARFYNEDDAAAAATPLLTGYPTMARRAGWHYLSRSFSTDGTAPLTLSEPNVTTAFPSMVESLRDSAVPTSVRAYNLSWIIHVVGDLHQPLHGTSRSTATHPSGDAGGNRAWVMLPGSDRDSTNLHALWDGWVGRSARGVAIDEVAAGLARDLPLAEGAPDDALSIPRGAALAATARSWADESATLARYVAYDLPPRSATMPPALPESYVTLSTRIARQRLALAAYRLAAVIEGQLGAG